MYAGNSHICKSKKGTLNLYAPTTDQPFIEESWLCSKERLNRTPPLSGASAFLAEMIEKYSGKVEIPFFPRQQNELGTVYPIHHLK